MTQYRLITFLKTYTGKVYLGPQGLNYPGSRLTKDGALFSINRNNTIDKMKQINNNRMQSGTWLRWRMQITANAGH
jgi:hypothetical protein